MIETQKQCTACDAYQLEHVALTCPEHGFKKAGWFARFSRNLPFSYYQQLWRHDDGLPEPEDMKFLDSKEYLSSITPVN